MTYIQKPFSVNGDKETIPQDKQDSGEISFDEGYGPDYEKDIDNDDEAKVIERNKLNWLLCLVTTEIKKYQENGVPDYITKAENGGIDFAYSAAALVRYNGKVYFSLTDANTNTPDRNTWCLFDPSAYMGTNGGVITGDLTINGNLDINGERPYTPSNPQPSTAAGLSIGTVQTLPAGVPATASVTGESPEQVLSLGIPVGDPGKPGDPGPANVLSVGTVQTLAAGEAATAEIIGTTPTQVLNLGIPRGESGGGSAVSILSDGKTYSPNADGVIKLGSAAGKNIVKDTDPFTLMLDKIPAWVPSESNSSLKRENSSAIIIDWATFAFTAGCSYSISKDSINDPLAGKGVKASASWSVTCLSNSYESTIAPGSFLIARESWKTKNSVFFLYRIYESSIIGGAQWMIGTVDMAPAFNIVVE
ncbi:hypothetical protein CHU32_03510 [Superficieibacter electus]|uniref:Phage tail protein n=1 Tax=Superficieibacter electus TaxID=2022662 RepID=A0A2P5GVD1_9ENTR|nr:hypothetical protein [Superficieibacter electus]POP42314.1 hypothetical protein CHU33_19795 [Superficieibacter electus]POP50503.1 hypothetical protein CHU32_03510 [Superficieibacter electus]